IMSYVRAVADYHVQTCQMCWAQQCAPRLLAWSPNGHGTPRFKTLPRSPRAASSVNTGPWSTARAPLPLQPQAFSLKPPSLVPFPHLQSFNMFRSMLSLLERNIAFSLAWLSGVDVLEHAMFSDGVFDVLRAALLSGGVIFADSRSFQQFLPFGAFKYKVIVIAGVLRLRSNSSYGPYNDVLAKISSVLDPSSSVLALGTCQNVVTNALSALRSNAIPAAALTICPLFPTAAALWEDWFDSIALSPTTQVCAIQTTFGGLDVIAITFGVLFHWTPPTPPPALPLTIGAGHETAELQSSQPPKA
ncbi:MAG: hypothetical protein ACTS44_01850, partial [Candidatus Hodgkinia cicadicola]